MDQQIDYSRLCVLFDKGIENSNAYRAEVLQDVSKYSGFNYTRVPKHKHNILLIQFYTER